MLTKNTPVSIPPRNVTDNMEDSNTITTTLKVDFQKQDLKISSNNRIPRLIIAKELFRSPIQSPRSYKAVNIDNELDVAVSPREPLPAETRPYSTC